ncbi:MAG TPA: Mg2+ and Co2+ transporter CorB [Prolixibacteraceae bacterium]|nr:Mg2+ and Co2+ transporter CorB [Prolixibacteraceae bacterium]
MQKNQGKRQLRQEVKLKCSLINNSQVIVSSKTASFLFSTFIITIAGEIFPQAYFTRHALRVGAALGPVLKFYKIIFFPISKPTGMILDRLIGEEAIPWFREDELRNVLKHHARESDTELSSIEATGAVNFLNLDDIPIRKEGEIIDPRSVLELPFEKGKPVFPAFEANTEDNFLKKIAASGKKWIILTDQLSKKPCMALNAPLFLRNILLGEGVFNPIKACHKPLIICREDSNFGSVLNKLTVEKRKSGDDVIDKDLILYWTDEEKRIITGSDILEYLMRNIAKVDLRKIKGSNYNQVY